MWHQALDADDVAALYASADPLYESNDSAYVNATKIVGYTYDAFDRRVLKEIDDDGDGDVDSASQYVYDGQDIVLAFDKDSELTNRYLHGPAVDQILADEQYGAVDHDDPAADEGIVYWPLADNQGSVRQLVTSDGEEAKRVEYDSFGQMTVASGAAVDHIFGYTGREHDAESHLQYNRARYYDAALGRWISEDPIGFAAGDANLSRYVGNGPTNATDPSGLDELDDRASAIRDQISTLEGANASDQVNLDQHRFLRDNYRANPTPDPYEHPLLTKKKREIDGIIQRFEDAIAKRNARIADLQKQLDALLNTGAELDNGTLGRLFGFLIDLTGLGGSVKSGVEVVSGEDYCEGRELTKGDRAIAAIGLIPWGKLLGRGGRLVKRLFGWGADHTDEAADVAGSVLKHGDDAVDGAGDIGKNTGKGGAGGPPGGSGPAVPAGPPDPQKRTLNDPLPAHPKKPTQANPHAPDPEATGPHTVVGTRTDPKKSPAPYRQGITYDKDGRPLGRTDVTDHGRGDHMNPHWHPYDPDIPNKFDPDRPGNFGPAQPLP